jgi:hypothetical protein
LDDPKPPASAEELLRRYAAGERAFPNANLRSANLSEAVLRGANFISADLRGADFTRGDLRGANLHSADLADANLRSANLHSANLRSANLSEAILGGAYLRSANLRGANLSDANLSEAILGGADLRSANLRGANLHSADLRGADFTGAILGPTLFVGVDLSPFCETRSNLVHQAPSIIDHTSILLSLHAPALKEFLAQAGMPEVFVDYMVDCALSLKSEVFRMLRSTFISYGSPDEAFARRLYEALHRNGVTTFFFPEHAVPGKKLHRTMRDGVNAYDRVILVCSQASLTRSGVLNEIEEALTREGAESGEPILIPIALDSYVFQGWTPPDPGTAKAIRARVVADFQGADTDPAKFQNALQRLIGALKK